MAEPQETREKPAYHPDWFRRSAVAPVCYAKRVERCSDPKYTSGGLFERAGLWFWPWTVRNYPGKHRGFLALLCRPVTWQAVQHWLAGRTRLPSDIALGLADTIQRRCQAGLALAAELREYAAKAPNGKWNYGFVRVDEVTGRDKRHRGGNKPKAPDSDVDL